MRQILKIVLFVEFNINEEGYIGSFNLSFSSNINKTIDPLVNSNK